MMYKITCGHGHSTVVYAKLRNGKYLSIVDSDWVNSGDGAPIRHRCGAPTESITPYKDEDTTK